MDNIARIKSWKLAMPPPQLVSAPAKPITVPATSRPDECFAAELVPTIFHQPWWLNSVSRGTYQEVQEMADGKCVGRLPFVQVRRHGMTVIGMPTLTHMLGPAVDEGDGNETSRRIRRITITRSLLRQLPRHSCLWIKCHRGTTDTLAFQAAAFLNRVQFTADVGPGAESKLWLDMRGTARRVIRRASEQLEVIDLQDPDEFMSFYDKNLRLRGIRNHYDADICRTTIAECLRRNAGRITVAVDSRRQLQAGVFTVWDERASYYLMTTRTPDADNGAISLLIWSAIKHASKNGLVFDFDGFNTAGDIQFFTRFGGRIVPRYVIEKASMSYRVVCKALQPFRFAER